MASSRSYHNDLYRAMKDGDRANFAKLLAGHRGRLNEDSDDCFALPLISAVHSESLECLQALIEAGAEVNRRSMSVKGSSYNMRALDAAVRAGEEEMERVLLEAGAVEDFGTYLFRGDVKRVRKLLKENPEWIDAAYVHPHFNLLHVAADTDSAAMVKLLMRHGLDPNATDNDGHAPLRYAARNAPCIDVLEALVEGGADVNHASHTGITALSAACRHAESMPTVGWLLEAGANPNIVPKNKVSPLMKAAGNRVAEMVEVLLSYGADPSYRGKNGETALAVAKRRKADAVVAVLEAGETKS